MTAPDGRITTYAYNAKNRLINLTDNGNVYAFTYNVLDRRTKLTNPNGTYTTYNYDADSRLTKLITSTSAETVIDSITNSYDKTINRTKTIEPTGTTKYTYDPVYRLIKTVLDTNILEKYIYDATGNRTTGPAASTNYTIDLGNQLTAKTGATFTYDSNGNIITKTEGATTYTYIYDGENRLTEAQNNGNTIATYKYDPFGNRIEKTVNGITTKYLYDGANILYEYVEANNIVTRYTHNLAIDEPLGIEKGGRMYAYHKDTLGSIRTITDSTQAIINTYSYNSFGNTTQTSTLDQPYAYTAREWDKETGLYYYRARYYDPLEGRFISRDPISFAGGDVNLYGYVQNNPVNAIDPWGLDTYYINRDLAVFGNSARSRSNPITHTFVAVTNPDGTIANTYSWGNDANLKGWNLNQPLDKTTAAEALKNNLAEKVGGSDLDSFVRQAYEGLDYPSNNHSNLLVTNNCKKEAGKLINRAKFLRLKELLKY